MNGPKHRVCAAHLYLPDGWLSPGYVEIDHTGTITAVAADRPATWQGRTVTELDGYVLPGMANLHSHAHQRGMAGSAEEGSGSGGARTFWTWRARMYDFALRLQPDDLEAIAAQAYMEMLEAGYTAVGEFHYLHHDPDGHPYEDRAEMARRLLAAAEQTGIGITLLPALYTQGGVGQPPSPEQRRFLYPSVDEFLALVAHVSTMTQECPQATVGVALHSLRAVGPAELLSAAASIPSEVPLHIHAAEQVREIEECREQLGTTPVRWLCEHLDVDARWTFIHATHADAWERSEIARRRAVVGLCPLTEANLGDGIFELVAFHEQGGRWGIGTDSNISVSVTDELRLLEYGQRLVHQRRDVLTAPGKSRDAQPGRIHFDTALAGGAQALGQPVGAIVQGRRADLIEIEPEAIVPLPSDLRTVIDQWVFACGKKVVRNVMVGGKWLVVDGKHVRESEISTRYRSILTSLLQGA